MTYPDHLGYVEQTAAGAIGRCQVCTWTAGPAIGMAALGVSLAAVSHGINAVFSPLAWPLLPRPVRPDPVGAAAAQLRRDLRRHLDDTVRKTRRDLGLPPA